MTEAAAPLSPEAYLALKLARAAELDLSAHETVEVRLDALRHMREEIVRLRGQLATIRALTEDPDKGSRSLARFWRPDLYDEQEPVYERTSRQLLAETEAASFLRALKLYVDEPAA